MSDEQQVDWRKPPRGMWAYGSTNAVDFRDYLSAVDEIDRLNQKLQQMTERKDAVNETLRLVVEERNRLRETLATRDRENAALADGYLSKMGIKAEDLR